MDKVKKFESKNNAALFASMTLIVSFFVSFFLIVLPTFPKNPTNPEYWGYFISSWNLSGPLMFISVFRIHALRVIDGRIRGKQTIGITLWVKFWFAASMGFGLLTLPFLAKFYLYDGASISSLSRLNIAIVVVAWITLLYSTLSMLQTKCSRGMEQSVKKARKNESIILAISSIVFLIFTGLSSIAILFP